MRTIRLVVEYDGTAFSGWQVQAGLQARETVQGALQEAVEKMTQVATRVRGASRTDAGVHARGQVAAFDTEKDSIGVLGFERGLTQLTPPQLVVRRAEEAPPGWDPKRSARGKRYRYLLLCDPVRDPLFDQRAWRLHDLTPDGCLAALNHDPTFARVAAERALLEVLDGSCRTPIAALDVQVSLLPVVSLGDTVRELGAEASTFGWRTYLGLGSRFGSGLTASAGVEYLSMASDVTGAGRGGRQGKTAEDTYLGLRFLAGYQF